MKTAAEHAIELLDGGRGDAARALLAADSENVRLRRELAAYKQEFEWLLSHARRLQVEVFRTEHDEAGPTITAKDDEGSYVLEDCPRLLSLMNGTLPYLAAPR